MKKENTRKQEEWGNIHIFIHLNKKKHMKDKSKTNGGLWKWSGNAGGTGKGESLTSLSKISVQFWLSQFMALKIWNQYCKGKQMNQCISSV